MRQKQSLCISNELKLNVWCEQLSVTIFSSPGFFFGCFCLLFPVRMSPHCFSDAEVRLWAGPSLTHRNEAAANQKLSCIRDGTFLSS